MSPMYVRLRKNEARLRQRKVSRCLTAHVDLERRAVIENGVPSTVFAGEVELLAAEAGHVGIACGRHEEIDRRRRRRQSRKGARHLYYIHTLQFSPPRHPPSCCRSNNNARIAESRSEQDKGPPT